jgi:hypothetical protein
MFGSWARRELTDGRDNDWAILTPEGRENDDDVVRLALECRSRFNEDGKAPGAQDGVRRSLLVEASPACTSASMTTRTRI